MLQLVIAALLVLVVDRGLPPEKLAIVKQAIAKKPRGVEVKLELAANIIKGVEHAFATTQKSKHARRQVVVVTDDGAILGIGPLGRALRAGGVGMSAVGIDSINTRTLTTIARAGDGRVHRVDDAAALARALAVEAQSPAPVVEKRAFVFVLDRSSAMKGARLETAKELVRVGIETIAAEDVVAVVVHDETAQILVPAQKATNRMRISADIARVQAGGFSNIASGATLAGAILDGIDATEKHMIVVSAGFGTDAGIADAVKGHHAIALGVGPDPEVKKLELAGPVVSVDEYRALLVD